MFKALSFAIMCLCFGAHALAADITVGIRHKIINTEYTEKTDNTGLSVLNHMLEGLLALGDDLRVELMLAESYAVSSDGRKYTFKIRQGVTFHNGAPLTANEVKWSLDRHRDSTRDWGAHCREYLDGSYRLYLRPANILAVTVVDTYTVEIELQSRNAMFPTLLAAPYCINAILHPDSVGKNGEWLTPVATGPFKFGELTEKGGAVLHRFEKYTPRKGNANGYSGGKQAYFDQIIYTYFENTDQLESAFENGTINFAVDVPYEHYQGFTKDLVQKTLLEGTPSWHQIMVNTRKNSLLNDVRIRRAMFHAVDQKALSKEMFGTEELANVSGVSRDSHYFTDVQKEGLPRDVQLSKKILKEAGYAGEPIELLANEKPYAMSATAANIVAGMMGEAGLNVQVKIVDWDTHKTTTYGGKAELSSMPVSALVDPVQMYGSITGQKQDLPWFMWEDPEADALISGAAMLADDVEKQASFNELHTKHISWVPTIGLYDYPLINLKSDCISGYQSWGMGLPRFWGVKKIPNCQ